MKKFVLVLALLTVALPAAAQLMDDGTVQIVGYWSRGDKYDYDYSKTKSRIIDGDTTVLSTMTERLTFEVVDSTATSYTLSLTFSDMRTSDESAQRVHDVVAAAGLEDITLLRTSEMGTFHMIANLDECLEQGRKAAEVAAPAIYAEISDEQKQAIPYDRFADMMKGMMGDPKAIQQANMEYIGRFFFYHGARLKIGHEYSIEDSIQGLFGGTAPTTLYFWADKELTDEVSAVMYTYNEIDAKDVTTKSMDNAMHALGLGDMVSEGGFAAVTGNLQLKIEDSSTVEVHLDSGWPLNIIQIRDIIATDENGKSVITQQLSHLSLAD